MLSDELLELQRLDTTADQLTYRRAHLEERVAADTAATELRTLSTRRDAIDVRDAELAAAIEGLEHDGARLTEQRTRLQAQLRTVGAPREAEALAHELEALATRRDGLDDQELAHLDEQAQLAVEREQLEVRKPAVSAAAATTGDALARAETEVDEQLGQRRSEKGALAARLESTVVDRYERLRARFGGVAVARLDGARCDGCHLDLSRGEVEAVRAEAADGVADCPQCGRLLVP